MITPPVSFRAVGRLGSRLPGWLRTLIPIGAMALRLLVDASAAPARITEESRVIPTYPFSEPNPVPILTRDRRLYPYHSFEGYSAQPEPKSWKVVRLENDWIEVFVLPEIGGKVWGAIVKRTGHEFIYRNEVMKFRNIALRGPWTSGGIEFNFGVIGHAPSTATPVDHLVRQNADGSVSCIVGTMDLPSRTHWRVEVRLPADRAIFETRVWWGNPTPLEQPYYNWMTAAAFARNDLELSYPGHTYLGHSGRAQPWPSDERGRDLSRYRQNAFGGHKSYHVVGELSDFFGGYYRDQDWGFGHWARYEDMPGRKLWLWGLAREGGIWEDLLTDTDGQYIEFQAGRLFVQYSPGRDVTPITQAGFEPLSSSAWTETWFPLEGTGGLTHASSEGALHVQAGEGKATIAVNAFRNVSDVLEVWGADRPIATTPVTLTALVPFKTTVDVPAGVPLRVRLAALALDYTSDPAKRRLARPFATEPAARRDLPAAEVATTEGRELLKARKYAEARAKFETALQTEPWRRDALLGLAELAYRSGNYEAGLAHANRALQLDAYDAKANFLAGILYRALQRSADARDAFGWAARSMAYRSAANALLADLMLEAGELASAERYARLALDYDRSSVPGWQALAIIGRLRGEAGARLAADAQERLLEIDPLHHFAGAERYLAQRTPDAAAALLRGMRSEFPGQTLLELAIGYANRGQRADALALLRLGADNGPIHRAWQAWLGGDPTLLRNPGSLTLAFPFRTESVGVLEWAASQNDDWRWQYLLALNLWAVDRDQEADERLRRLGNAPDFAPLYVARAALAKSVRNEDATADLRRAVALDSGTRIHQVELVRHLQRRAAWDEALAASSEARTIFPGDFNLELLHARALIHLGRAREATEILARTHVLPSENARDSHQLYATAHTLVGLDALEAGRFEEAKRHLGLALEWPESLGQGRPYQPEERLVRFLLGRVAQRMGDAAARALFAAVVTATPEPGAPRSRLDLIALPALAALGRTDELRAIAGSRDSSGRLAREASRMAAKLLAGEKITAEEPGLLAGGRDAAADDMEARMLARAIAAP